MNEVNNEEEKREERYFGGLQKMANGNLNKSDITPSLPPIVKSLTSNSTVFFTILISAIFIFIGVVMYSISEEYSVTGKLLFLLSVTILYFVLLTTSYFRRDYHPLYRLATVILAGLCVYIMAIIVFSP